VRHVVEPPVSRFVERPYVVRPGYAQIVTEPAVVALERRRVKVRSGGTAWRPVGARW
jgi:hypothetical protein